MKVAVITCYFDPDYVRGKVIRDAIGKLPEHDLLVVKNKHKGLLRYAEVIGRVLWLRLSQRPDVYIVTFRGYEILPFVCILSWPKTVIYDELVNPLEWLAEDRKEVWTKFVPKQALRWFYRQLLKRCRNTIADTPSHAKYSAQLAGVSNGKFRTLPVGTDESVFNTRPTKLDPKVFRVFYYGSMLPLHGLDKVLDAAAQLKDQPIEFVIAGGGQPAAELIAKYSAQGANLVHKTWIPYQELPLQIAASNLVLGGPFGDTVQASHVITGKTYQFLACAAPVLIGRNSNTQLFVDKQNCLTVPLGDVKAIVKQILWAYEHPKPLAKIGRAGRLLYNKNFSTPAIAKELSQILKT